MSTPLTPPVLRPAPPPLDAAVAELAQLPARTWGVRDAALGVLAVPASLVVAVLLSGVLGLPGVLATALATVLLAVAAAGVARRAVRQSGGWRAAFGLDLPEWSDTGRVVGWCLLLLVVRAVAVGLLGLVPALQGVPADNTSFLRSEPLAVLLVVAVLAVAVAPVLEELLFRGLVLRGLMLRLGFWPAALLSSAAFGLFHAPGFGTEAVPLVVATGIFGLGLCVLTRRTGRLGPGIGVHALSNALAIAAVGLT